jgi:hypothetical protein
MAAIQPFDPWGIIQTALLNPVVLLVALWLGWQADQWQKVLVAGFAAAFAGAVAIWLAASVGLITVKGFGGEAGVFVASMIYGWCLAGIAFALSRRRQA